MRFREMKRLPGTEGPSACEALFEDEAKPSIIALVFFMIFLIH